jgi:hypothetical protein
VAGKARDNLQFIADILLSAETRVSAPYEAERPIGALRNAYARSNANFKFGLVAPAAKREWTTVKPLAIIFTSNGQRLSQLSGAIREPDHATGPAAALVHCGNSAQGLKSADKHATGLSFAICHDVKAFVHAIYEVNVRAAWGTEQDSGALGDAARCVSGEILQAEIRLRFHDHPGGRTMQKHAA